MLGVVALAIVLRRGLHRLPSRPAEPFGLAPMRLAAAAALMLAGPIALGLLGARLGLVPGAAPTLAGHARAAGVVYAAEALVALLWWIGARPRPDAGALSRPRAIRAGLLGLLLWWPVTALTAMLGALLVLLGGGSVGAVAHDTLRLLAEEPAGPATIAVVALVVIAAPLFEELLYRELLQGAFRSTPLGPRGAIVAVSAIFAAMHWGNSEPHAVLALFVLSLGLGTVRERAGRLAAPVAMHAAFNAGNLLVAALGPA